MRPRAVATGRSFAVLRRAFPGLLIGALVVSADPGHAQELGDLGKLEAVDANYPERMSRQVEAEAHAAILAHAEESDGSDDIRDAHVEGAEALAREFLQSLPRSADAHYWLGLSLGLKAEYSGAFAKLTSGRESFEHTMRALELDPDHAGAHELLGRIHAGVMRLPWLVRKLGASMGMSDALGDASWETAEENFVRAATLDPAAIAPRLELGKLLVERDRQPEARRWFDEAVAIEPSNALDRAMQNEAREWLSRLPPS